MYFVLVIYRKNSFCFVIKISDKTYFLASSKLEAFSWPSYSAFLIIITTTTFCREVFSCKDRLYQIPSQST